MPSAPRTVVGITTTYRWGAVLGRPQQHAADQKMNRQQQEQRHQELHAAAPSACTQRRARDDGQADDRILVADIDDAAKL